MVVVITGASSGIGLSTARFLKDKGFDVVGLSRHPKTDEGFEGIACDLTDFAATEVALKEIAARKGKIDVLVNNAGMGIAGAAEHTTMDDVQKQFPDLNSLESIMAQGAKHFKYYFPNDTLPKLYTVVSGFQESMFPTEGIIAVSLDKYLGNTYPHYESLGIEVYKRRRMIPEMIPADYFRCIAMLNYPKDENAAFNILNEMIYEGRIQYFLNCMLPETPDSTRWGSTDFQYRWAEYYEEEIWDYLVDKKMLFDTNPIAVRNFTGEGPFTNAFGNNSAPGCASYCGYRIVCSYMRHNPDVTLKDLMKIKDMNQIYNKARYNP